MFELKNALKLSHDYMDQLVQEGDSVVDATVGNGKDTLFLASLVGSSGKVYGFDVVELAIERTREKLLCAGLAERVVLIHDGHEQLQKYVKVPIRYAAFNLGYLPGGDKSVTTKTKTTLSAVSSALELLQSGGICSICVYPGHEEGDEELRSLSSWLQSLDYKKFGVIHRAFVNQPKRPPELFVIQKNF